ncbi:MAG: FliG C-terminal domain-containing protein [Armatimonadota bacterium]
MALKTHDLTGIDKASVLLMSLGASRSAKVFEHLDASERELLGAHIAGLRHVDDVIRQVVFEEVSCYIKSGHQAEIEKDAVGSDEPLKWLEKLDPCDVALLLGSERPQNVALVLAHLAPQAAALVLSNLGEGLRNQATSRLIGMRPPSREVVEAVDEAMRKRFAGTSGRAQTAARETLLGLLGNAKERVRESIVGVVSKPEPKGMFVGNDDFASPEALVSFTDSEVRKFISEIDREDLYLALRVASDDLKSVIVRNAPEDLALTIHRELVSPLQARLREIEFAQERFVNVMQRIKNETGSDLSVSSLEVSVD